MTVPGMMAMGAAMQLQHAQKFFDKSTSALEEADAGFAPQPELFTAAAQIAHVGLTIDWFVDGAFSGQGWDMDFAKLDGAARAVKTLAEARAITAKAFERAIKAFGSAGDDVLGTGLAEDPIMQGAPRIAFVGAIADHTAHHRGSLAIYTRLLGKVPPMPYM